MKNDVKRDERLAQIVDQFYDVEHQIESHKSLEAAFLVRHKSNRTLSRALGFVKLFKAYFECRSIHLFDKSQQSKKAARNLNVVLSTAQNSIDAEFTKPILDKAEKMNLFDRVNTAIESRKSGSINEDELELLNIHEKFEKDQKTGHVKYWDNLLATKAMINILERSKQ